MYFFHKSILLLPIYLLFSSSLWAVEFDMQAERVFWRYQQDAKGVAANLNEFPSKADGDGALLKFRLSTERDQDWFFALSTSMMDSTSWADEVWGSVQTNELSVKQLDTRIDMQYRMLDARFGIWLSHRQQTQQRQNLYVNNIFTPVAGAILEEEVISDWAGLSLTSVGGNAGQFETRIDAAVPISVSASSPLLSEPFTKQDGFRAGVHFRWSLPAQEMGVSRLNVTLRYEYQELGGESNPANGFWPYNSWQMTAIGLMYAW